MVFHTENSSEPKTNLLFLSFTIFAIRIFRLSNESSNVFLLCSLVAEVKKK